MLATVEPKMQPTRLRTAKSLRWKFGEIDLIVSNFQKIGQLNVKSKTVAVLVSVCLNLLLTLMIIHSIVMCFVGGCVHSDWSCYLCKGRCLHRWYICDGRNHRLRSFSPHHCVYWCRRHRSPPPSHTLLCIFFRSKVRVRCVTIKDLHNEIFYDQDQNFHRSMLSVK